MFDLFKLSQKREELQVALAGAAGNFSDAYHMNFSCEGCGSSCSGGCQGDCSGECMDSSRGHMD